MSRISLPYDDLDNVLALLSDWRSVKPFDRIAAYPTIYRLGLLLSSRIHDSQRDARIWIETWGNDWDEELIGVAALWSRNHDDKYRALEGPFILPDLDAEESASLADDVLIWAQQRTREIGQARGEPVSLTAVARQNDSSRRDMLMRWGFELYAPNGNIYWERSLAAIDQPIMPAGFTIGPLSLEDHYVEYDQLYRYEFGYVDEAHRWDLLRDPDYAFLAATAPNRYLAAHCEVSVCRREWLPGAPRIGWVDYIGVDGAYRRRGLARAILTAGLVQLREWGAEHAMLVTTPGNTAANALYEAAGFTVAGYEDSFRWPPDQQG
ncbi:MAG: GNAT family N-acetyltransferase [Nitrososphaerota archaeon]